MGNDLISREEAKEEISAWARVITNPKILSAEDTMSVLDMLAPVDAVPVVRCRDCIRRKTLRNGSHVCPYSTVDLDLDGFCHRGKRKDDVNGCK